MATVTYVGSHDAVEVPHLDWQVFKQGEPVDVPDDQLGNFAEQEVWKVETGKPAPPESAPEPAAVPAEGN